MNVSSFVTAGGRSSRMGTDKAWLELNGRAMIEHVISAVEPISSRVTIIANSPDYERLGYLVIGDSQTGVGPLEAIRTALAAATTDRIIVVGCDLPFVTPELFSFLLKVSEHHLATVPIGPDGKLEPLCAVYHRRALNTVSDLIRSGKRKVSVVFDNVPTRFVSFDELAHLPDSNLFFENVNTPEDYSRVRGKS